MSGVSRTGQVGVANGVAAASYTGSTIDRTGRHSTETIAAVQTRWRRAAVDRRMSEAAAVAMARMMAPLIDESRRRASHAVASSESGNEAIMSTALLPPLLDQRGQPVDLFVAEFCCRAIE
jgi:hypothetical protein